MSPLYDRLAARAAQAPDAPALQCGGRQLTAHDFVALVDTTALRFQAEGLGEGDSIGWLDHNSPEMLAALLACAKLGAVWVPLNWRLAAPELAAIARHAGLSALKHGPALAGLAAQVLALSPISGPAEAAQPGDVMLVYTSGTTGEPKGAMHSQAGMLANIDIATEVQGLSEADRVLAVLPLFHVGGLCIQVLPALACGAPVNLHARFDPGAWLRDAEAWRPTTSLLVPAVMQALLAHPDWPAAGLGSLRFVNSGSSIVPVTLIDAFHARGLPVAQVYGSTETGPFSIALRPDEALCHVGSVGGPAPGGRGGRAAAPGATVTPRAGRAVRWAAPPRL
ncbi:MAG: AMP-binding protein, partial [Burkholderiaceae bacterium]|nr:AMP-binding protein [Burkholderiaceae bacterium]